MGRGDPPGVITRSAGPTLFLRTGGRRGGWVGIMAEGILAQQTPHHGTEKEKKKTDDTGQYEKYRPGIGPHLFDFRDDPHQ